MQPKPEFPSREYSFEATNQYSLDAAWSFDFNPRYPESRGQAHDALDLAFFKVMNVYADADVAFSGGKGDSIEKLPEDAEFPSVEYVFTAREVGTDIVVSEKVFNPRYYPARRRAHASFDWATANGHDIAIEIAT
jgi:hypothetical protein